MMMMKAIIAILLQLPLIILTQDVALSESNNRDNSTQIELTSTSANLTESTTPDSTILGNDKNETNSTEPPTSTTPLIPLATVEAQIVKANISSRKPSRLQAAT